MAIQLPADSFVMPAYVVSGLGRTPTKVLTMAGSLTDFPGYMRPRITVEDPVVPDEAARDLKDAARRDMEDAIRTFQQILGQRRETFDDGVTVTGPES